MLKRDYGHIGVIAVCVFAFIWTAIVVLSGLGYNVRSEPWDFSVTGSLGDSFGVLSSGMAGIAAYFAYGTYRAAQEEGRVAERRAFEASFLNLAERRFDVLDRVRLTYTRFGGGEVSTANFFGQEVLDRLHSSMKDDVEKGKTLAVAYSRATKRVHGLSSYLRFTYHLVALIDRNNFEQKATVTERDSHGYQLIRLLRAQMTDSELVLIALNCIVGSGYAKFRPLAEKYALLHNLTEEDKKLFRIDEFFRSTAFGLSKVDQSSPSDTPPQEWLDAINVDHATKDVPGR